MTSATRTGTSDTRFADATPRAGTMHHIGLMITLLAAAGGGWSGGRGPDGPLAAAVGILLILLLVGTGALAIRAVGKKPKAMRRRQKR